MFAINEPLFTAHFGHMPSYAQEWTSSRPLRNCPTPNSHVQRHGDSETSYLQDHQAFNLALNYDSSLNTPASLNTGSPITRETPSSGSPWCRNNSPPIQFQQRGNDAIYMASNSMSMKSRNSSSPVHMPSTDNPLSMSSYVFEPPQSQCPPSPYWGAFSVSEPQAATTPSPTRTSTPQSQSNISSSNRGHAPALATLLPLNTHLSPHQQPHQQAQQVPSQIQAQQSHQQGPGQRARYKKLIALSKSKRRRKSPAETKAPASGPLTMADLTDEDKLLLRLKDIKEEEEWEWKDLTIKFNEITKGNHKVAALQMRYTRLAERMRVWTDTEIRALARAKQQFDTMRWKTIAANMLEYGCKTKWSPRACQLKWTELHPEDLEALGLAPPPNPVSWDAEAEELGEFDDTDADAGRGSNIGGAVGQQPVSISPYEQQQSWAVRPHQ